MPAAAESPLAMAHHAPGLTPDLKKLSDFLLHGPPGPHYYAVLLGLQVYDLVRLMERVERGLPYGALERFQRNIAWSSVDVLDWLQISQRTLTRRRKQG